METWLFFLCIFSFILIAAVCLYVWFVKPIYVYHFIMRMGIFLIGAKVKSIKIDGKKWSYIETGSPHPNHPTMLFVHGFSSSKESWIPILKYLHKGQHVIAPDLPGHGGTDKVTLQDDIYGLFVQKLQKFVCAVGLEKEPFHIIGLSMGGAITLCYTAAYSQLVLAATIICPAIATPTPSEMHAKRTGEKSPLVDHTLDGTRRMLSLVSHKTQLMPKQLMKGFMQTKELNQEFLSNLYILLSMTNNRQAGIHAAENITCPSQVIWGAGDKMLHPSGANVLQEKLPNMKELHILPECGHAVMMDKPVEVSQLITDFSNFAFIHENLR